MFTATVEGALVFRAMQRVLLDTETISVLRDTLAIELKNLEIEQTNKNSIQT